jgi:hypothetical protein
MTLAEIRNQIKLKIQDKAAILADTDIDYILIAALQQFSRDCPQELVADIAGDGGYEYDLPADWQPGNRHIWRIQIGRYTKLPPDKSCAYSRIRPPSGKRSVSLILLCIRNPASAIFRLTGGMLSVTWRRRIAVTPWPGIIRKRQRPPLRWIQ